MKPLSILLFASRALALNPLHPIRHPNNSLVSEPTTDIVSDPLAKRWTCPSTCSTNICCDNGLCVWSLSDVCCGSYFCNSGEHCCGTGCMPSGADCCGVQGYCPPGERCMTVNGKLGCCPNGDCSHGNAVDHYTYTNTQTHTQNDYTTAYHTTTATYTGVEWTWYSWTVTWTYWVTFYTYYAPVTASIRTSTVTTTSTVVSVRATDGADASSSFTRLSATMSFYTPASATDPVTPTDVATASSPTLTSGSDGGSGSSGSGSGSNGGSVGISANGVVGGAPNAANANSRLGWETGLALSVVLGTGLLMVYL